MQAPRFAPFAAVIACVHYPARLPRLACVSLLKVGPELLSRISAALQRVSTATTRAIAPAVVRMGSKGTAALTMASVWWPTPWLAWASSTCTEWSAFQSPSWLLLFRYSLCSHAAVRAAPSSSTFAAWNVSHQAPVRSALVPCLRASFGCTGVGTAQMHSFIYMHWTCTLAAMGAC